jgi:high-affinity nickel-transport protein
VLIYKPWRRRIDKKRVRNAHFEPLSQDQATAGLEEEELQHAPVASNDVPKDMGVSVEPVEVTDAAGPVHHGEIPKALGNRSTR